MNDSDNIREQIQAFGDQYQYEVRYQLALFDASPAAYAAFTAGTSMSSYRQALPLDAHYVARVSVAQAEDCGPCAQLNLRMAVEAGVDRSLLDTLINRPDQLTDELRDVREHAQAVCQGPSQDTARAARISARYGEEAFAELAVCITGSRLFPTTKRALLEAGHCEILTMEF